MYIRIKTTPNSPRKSVQIVEGSRVGGKVKQKILRHVGIAMDDAEEKKLYDLAAEIMAKMLKEKIDNSPQMSLFEADVEELEQGIKNRKKHGRKIIKKIEDILPPSQVRLDEIIEKERLVDGVHEVGKVVYDGLGYDTILSKRDGRILQDLVLARLAYPKSKHKLKQLLSTQFGKEHDLDAIYRMMDKLFERIGYVKKCTFERMASLFPHQVNLVLFDVTTLYFETTEADELRAFGYSKDCRFNTTQVVLALATNDDGLPVGYELFEGNKAEVKTLVEAIENWKMLFNIGSVCFVGDRAMFSRGNLALLEERGYNYVVAAKLRGLSSDTQTQILDEQNYKAAILKKELAWIGEFKHDGRRLIVSYKTKRAIKDAKDRQKQLDKIKKLIGEKGQTRKLLSNSAVKKFTVSEQSSTIIDDEKVAHDALWDGMHGVITNLKDDAPENILACYSRLWIIEESFRINKHQLRMRPIFHWKPERIHAHIAICYMAFAVLRHLQYRVELTQKVSPEIIIEELQQVQSSIYVHKKTGDLYRVPGKFSNIARKIYKAFSIDRSLDASIYA